VCYERSKQGRTNKDEEPNPPEKLHYTTPMTNIKTTSSPTLPVFL
jgi:hypothetical protein